MASPLLLSTAYLPPIQYLSKFMGDNEIIIEQYDNYQKQTYRNRCRILAGNGVLDLTVPVVKNSGQKTLVKDVLIDYDTEWQHAHWRSLVSAYNSSPFFEYYCDDFKPFYRKKYKHLIDFNTELLKTILEILALEPNFNLSDDYHELLPNIADFRTGITPKKSKQREDISFTPKAYTQTFDDKFGFQANLSIVDLIFNLGPEAEVNLRECAI